MGVAPVRCPRDRGGVQAAPALTTIGFMNDTIRRLSVVAASVLAASPALACGGPRLTSLQMSVLVASMATAPILAALLVDRGAFALGAHAMDLQRRHTPTVIGPVLAAIAVVVALGGASVHAVGAATLGFALVPVAAAVCGISFVRSVIIDLRGQLRAQLLRVGAVVAFAALALARFAM